MLYPVPHRPEKLGASLNGVERRSNFQIPVKHFRCSRQTDSRVWRFVHSQQALPAPRRISPSLPQSSAGSSPLSPQLLGPRAPPLLPGPATPARSLHSDTPGRCWDPAPGNARCTTGSPSPGLHCESSAPRLPQPRTMPRISPAPSGILAGEGASTRRSCRTASIREPLPPQSARPSLASPATGLAPTRRRLARNPAVDPGCVRSSSTLTVEVLRSQPSSPYALEHRLDRLGPRSRDQRLSALARGGSGFRWHRTRI